MQTDTITTPFGRRAMTLGHLAAQLQARALDPEKSVDKWKLYRALCEARPRLGVTDRALALLNALLSFHPHAELCAAKGLVVFPSNAQLSLRANGMAEATIRRHLAVLVEAGLISRKDSANGKRYARRAGDGELGEAFGFSLAPLVARHEEIERLAAAVVAERIALQRLRERITICRRDIAKLITTALESGAATDWQLLHAQFREVVDSLQGVRDGEVLERALGRLEEIRSDVINRLEMLPVLQETIASPDQNERHKQNSNTDSLIELEPLLEKEQGERLETKQQKPVAPRGFRDGKVEGDGRGKPYPLGMVLSACPDIADYGPGGAVASWRDLMSAAVVIRTMLGVSPSAYQAACDAMGPETAATVMACILERAGHINSAGGYLRGLTAKAEQGEFSCGPMLMALLRRNKGAPDALRAG